MWAAACRRRRCAQRTTAVRRKCAQRGQAGSGEALAETPPYTNDAGSHQALTTALLEPSHRRGCMLGRLRA